MFRRMCRYSTHLMTQLICAVNSSLRSARRSAVVPAEETPRQTWRCTELGQRSQLFKGWYRLDDGCTLERHERRHPDTVRQ